MRNVPLDREHFGGYQPILGDTVEIRLPPKFMPFRPQRSRSITYIVNSVDPLMAFPFCVTHVIKNGYAPEDWVIKKRFFRHA